MKVHRDEGVANRIAPESCVAIREGCGEASIGECTGQPLSRERSPISGADAVQMAEGNTDGAPARAPNGPAWSKTLACADVPCAGTGRSLPTERRCPPGPHREGEEP